ncbi:MAG: hypothetical protein DRH56_02855 [Deltaproteobacteria bacterium]|nr:MAG: hypothetical protein DRH56_02855 [Deltaproteobacteria bacterium]
MRMLNGDRRNGLLLMGGALVTLLLLCGVAFASGGGEHAAEHANGQMFDLLKRVINFALMVIVLVVVIKKTDVAGFFRSRIEEIKKRFEGLNAEKDATRRRFEELERKLKEFEEKKREMIEQFRADGEAEKERIISDARERARQILEQATQAIEREMKAARDRLMREVVDAAALKAQELIAAGIRDSDQDHLVDEFIQKVEKLH